MTRANAASSRGRTESWNTLHGRRSPDGWGGWNERSCAGTPLFGIWKGPALGKPFDPGYERLLFKPLVPKADIRKRVHPHGPPPGCGTHTQPNSAKKGIDIGIISTQLGPRDISTTARNLDHVASCAVVEAVAEEHD